MPTSPDTSDIDWLKFRREAIAAEIAYRREKQWRIFSWTSGLLLASIGGVVALIGARNFCFTFYPYRILMVVSIAIVAFYAGLWIRENIKYETSARSIILEVDAQAGIPETLTPDPKTSWVFGYVFVVALLASAAILAVLLAP